MYLGRRVKRMPVKKMPWNPTKQNVLVQATYFLCQSSLIEKKKKAATLTANSPSAI